MTDEKLNMEMTDEDVWELLKEIGASESLGISKEEFIIIAQLTEKGYSDEDISSFIKNYRNKNKKITVEQEK